MTDLLSIQRPAPVVPSISTQPTSAPTSSQSDILQLADVVRFLAFTWRHKYRIAVGLTIALGCGLVYLTRTGATYETTAKLLVVKKSPLAVDGRTSIPLNTDAMSTHVALLTSPWMADRVLADEAMQRLATFEDQETPKSTLSKSLFVLHERDDKVPVSDSNILRLSFRSRYREDGKLVLNKLVKAYSQYLDDSNRSVNQDALKLITTKADEIGRKLAAKEAEYEAFRADFKLLQDADQSRDSKMRLSEIGKTKFALITRRAELESRLDSLRNAVSKNRGSADLRALLPVDMQPDDPRALDEKLLPLLVEQRRLLTRYGEGHPDVRRVKEQIAITKQMLDGDDAAGVGEQRLMDAARAYAHLLKQDIREVQAAESSLNQLESSILGEVKREIEDAAKFAGLELKDSQLKNSIAREQQYHDTLMSQLQGLDIGMASGGYQTTLIAPPSKPVKVAPRTLLSIVGATILGLLLGYGYAFVAETMDRSFHNTAEVVQTLRLPVLGRIPNLRTSTTIRNGKRTASMVHNPLLCAHVFPESEIAEAFRGVRTAMCFRTGDRQHQIIQVTGPHWGNGATLLAANLAISLAHSGKSVLLVDADWHEPQVHSLFGISGEQGLSLALKDTSKLDLAICQSGIAGLSLLPCGETPDSPADVLASPRLKYLFTLLRERYDYVLLATPPLLSAVDAQIVAANVDQVLLAIKPIKNGRPAAARATDLLRFLGAEILGVVLNDTNGFLEDAPICDTEADHTSCASTI